MPTIGATANCASCGAQIVFKDPYWDHTGENKPRHIAQPSEAPHEAQTPGPWHTEPLRPGIVSIAASDDMILGDLYGPNAAANARLIVAALDLLAAAQAVLDSAARELSYTDEVRLVSTSALDALRAAVAAVEAGEGSNGV